MMNASPPPIAPKARVLEVDGLRKSFGGLTAVSDVSFTVGAGETIGLLGPNGAGKSTTVGMIAGWLRPDAGEVRVNGRALAGDTDPAKSAIGLVPQDLALFEDLPARENLRFFGALYRLGGPALEEAIATGLTFVGLAERARDKVKTFSGGMKRRLNLAAGLLHDPQLVLLDEPTVGIDPQSRNAIFDNLEALRARGKALVYPTHYMEEAERLCDRIVIVDNGRVIANDTVRGLYGLLPASRRLSVELRGTAEGLAEALRALPSVESAEVAGGRLTAVLRDLSTGAPAVLAVLQQRGVAYEHVVSERGDLETVFLTLTGRKLRD
jgi:linearmycin/streptolysin S transport system ATP-binding protein